LNTQDDQNKSQRQNPNNPTPTRLPSKQGKTNKSREKVEVSSEMLASTVQFSKNNRAHQNHTTHNR
jgi:hypothetical protein